MTSVSKYDPSKDIPDLSGKVILVTGGNTGLGKESILHLAQHSPKHIYFTSRSAEKANEAIADVTKLVSATSISFILCDLADLRSVEAAAKQVCASTPRLDILMCNAGIMNQAGELSKDGYEIQFATNHMGHALLIKLLLPTLLKTVDSQQPGRQGDVRIVILSSAALATTPKTGVEFETVKTAQNHFSSMNGGWIRYGQSKLANALYAAELAKRYPQITCVSLHPGMVRTDLFRTTSAPTRALINFMNCIGLIEVLGPGEGAYHQCWAATTKASELQNGSYYEPLGVIKEDRSKFLKDSSLSEELWNWTQEELDGFSATL